MYTSFFISICLNEETDVSSRSAASSAQKGIECWSTPGLGHLLPHSSTMLALNAIESIARRVLDSNRPHSPRCTSYYELLDLASALLQEALTSNFQLSTCFFIINSPVSLVDSLYLFMVFIFSGVEIGAIVEGSREFFQQVALLQACSLLSPLFALPLISADRALPISEALFVKSARCCHQMCSTPSQKLASACFFERYSSTLWNIFNLTKLTSIRQYLEILLVNFYEGASSSPAPVAQPVSVSATLWPVWPHDLLDRLPRLSSQAGEPAPVYKDFCSARAMELCSLVTVAFYQSRSQLKKCGTRSLDLFSCDFGDDGIVFLRGLSGVQAALSLLSTSSTGFLRGIAQCFFFELYEMVEALLAAVSILNDSVVSILNFRKHCVEPYSLLYHYLKHSEEFSQVLLPAFTLILSAFICHSQIQVRYKSIFSEFDPSSYTTLLGLISYCSTEYASALGSLLQAKTSLFFLFFVFFFFFFFFFF